MENNTNPLTIIEKEEKLINGKGIKRAIDIAANYADYGDKNIMGKYNGEFPLTSAVAGNVYLLKATGKFYVCVANYNGTNLTAPNANFEELSVYTNRNKLENLQGIDLFGIATRIGADTPATVNLKSGATGANTVVFALMAGDKSWAGKLALSYIISNNKLYIYTSADGNLGAICYAVKYLF